MQKDNITFKFLSEKLNTIRKNIEKHIENKSIHNEVKINYNSQFSDRRKVMGR